MAKKNNQSVEEIVANAPKNRTVQTLVRRLQRGNGEEIPAMRKEYTRLQKMANKRIKRAQAAGDLLDTELFPLTRTINKQDEVALAKNIVAVEKFLNSRQSTAAGRKEIARGRVEKLNKLGYENITVDNEKLFTEFMEMWRTKYAMETSQGRRMTMDSDTAVEIFDSISEKFTPRTNKSAMSRYFNDYLRANDMEDLIIRRR